MTSVAHLPVAATTVRYEARRDQAEAARYTRRSRNLDKALGVAVPLCLVLIWQLATSQAWIDGRFYPAPTSILRDSWELFQSGRLQSETWVTLKLLLFGYVTGSVAGYIVGLLMGCISRVRAALEPLLTALYVVPKLALLPIFLTVFGFGEAPKVVLVAVTVFFFVWIETMEAINQVPKGYLEAAQSFQLRWHQMFRHIYFPASLAQVFVGLRVSMGVAVLITIAAEFVMGGQGLGFLIFNSRQLFQIGYTYVGIVWVAILGVMLTACVAWAGSFLTPWTGKSRRH